MDALPSTLLLAGATLISSSGGLPLEGRWISGNQGISARRMPLGYAEVATLLERFKENPLETRHSVRVELGLLDNLAAEMFALAVFVSDGILQVKDTSTPSPAARFFSISAQLPLELQMVLCFRQVGSDKEIIQGKDSEVAFKSLARRL